MMFTVTAHLICSFVSAYANIRVSYDVAEELITSVGETQISLFCFLEYLCCLLFGFNLFLERTFSF